MKRWFISFNKKIRVQAIIYTTIACKTDFGSPPIKKKTERKMKEAGVEIFPYRSVLFYLLANRLNYRTYRKIIVIDGQTAFTGGINVSEKYINNKPKKL